MTTASDEGDENTPTNPHIEAPSRTQPAGQARPSAAPPGFTPRAPTLPKGGASPSQRPPVATGGSTPTSVRPALGFGAPALRAAALQGPPTGAAAPSAPSVSTSTSSSSGASFAQAALPRISALPSAPAAERASSPPGFLMPKPSAGATGAGEPSDPWRERLAGIEVQAQATRALAQRTADDASAMRQRAEAAEMRVRALETELGARVAELEKERGERRPSETASDPSTPATPEGLAERLERVDKLASQARVALDTIQQDLSEHARLFEARKSRLDSLDARVRAAENDPRFAELTRKVESFDLTLSRLLPHLEGAAGLGERVAGFGERFTGLDARVIGLDAGAAALVARVAALEVAVTQSAARAAPAKAVAEPVDEVRALKGVGPKLAKQLRDLGVTTVAEIAGWSDTDVASFAEKLGTTPAKIKKAGWVEAARACVPGGG